MAVCAEQPDARALIGLARVALAHGLAEDAAVFAREALALEPASAEQARSSQPDARQSPPDPRAQTASPACVGAAQLRSSFRAASRLPLQDHIPPSGWSTSKEEARHELQHQLNRPRSSRPKRPATRSRGPKRSLPPTPRSRTRPCESTRSRRPRRRRCTTRSAVAAQSYEQLHQSERHLSFHVDGRTGKLADRSARPAGQRPIHGPLEEGPRHRRRRPTGVTNHVNSLKLRLIAAGHRPGLRPGHQFDHPGTAVRSDPADHQPDEHAEPHQDARCRALRHPVEPENACTQRPGARRSRAVLANPDRDFEQFGAGLGHVRHRRGDRWLSGRRHPARVLRAARVHARQRVAERRHDHDRRPRHGTSVWRVLDHRHRQRDQLRRQRDRLRGRDRLGDGRFLEPSDRRHGN